MQKTVSQTSSSDKTSNKPTPFELMHRDEQDKIVLHQAQLEHDLYLTKFFAQLQEIATIKNRHVFAMKSLKSGSDFPFPSMNYFRKEKKSQNRIKYKNFMLEKFGNEENVGLAIVETANEPVNQ